MRHRQVGPFPTRKNKGQGGSGGVENDGINERCTLDTWDELWSPGPMKTESYNQGLWVSIKGAGLPLCPLPHPLIFFLPCFIPPFLPSPKLDLASRMAMVPGTHAVPYLSFILSNLPPFLRNLLPTRTLSPSQRQSTSSGIPVAFNSAMVQPRHSNSQVSP